MLFWTSTPQCPPLPTLAICSRGLLPPFPSLLYHFRQRLRNLHCWAREHALERQKESNKLLQMTCLYNSLAKGANIRCVNVLSRFNVFIHPWCMKADGVWEQMQVWWWQFKNELITLVGGAETTQANLQWALKRDKSVYQKKNQHTKRFLSYWLLEPAWKYLLLKDYWIY